MKTLLKVYIYVMYVAALPLFLVFSAVLLVWNAIENIKDYGEWDIKEAFKAYAEGIMEGHQINMARIEHLDDDEFQEEL